MLQVFERFLPKKKRSFNDDLLSVLNLGFPARRAQRISANALQNTTFYRCVGLKAGIVSTLPVRLIERATKKDATGHPIYRLLQHPNEEQTGVEFWMMMLANFYTHGNAFAEKVIERGRVVELLPMATCHVAIERNKFGKFYQYASSSLTVTLPSRLVAHFRQFGTDGTSGLSPAKAAEIALQQAAAQQSMILETSENGGVPKLVIKLPPEKLLERINTLEPGAIAVDANTIQAQIENAKTRLALYLPAGYEGTPLNANFNDLQTAQLVDFAVAEIARIQGVPLSKLGVVSKSDNGKSAEQSNLEFYQDTLRADVVNLEKRLEAELLTEAEQQRYQIKFNDAAIRRADFKTQVEGWVALQQQGNIVTDEIREWMDMPPFGTPESTTPRFPVNQTTEQVPNGSQPTNPADGGVPARKATRASLPAASLRSLDARLEATRKAKPAYVEALGRVVRKEKATIGKITKAALQGRAGTGDITAALTRLYATDGELRTFIEKNIAKPVEFLFEAIRAAMEAELGLTFPDYELRKVVKAYIDIWARDYAHSSEFQIRALIAAGTSEAEVLAAIEQRLDEWEEKRPEKESNDETNRGRNVFAKALYTLAGVSMIRWVSSGNPCPLCDPLDGRTFSPQNIPQCPLHQGCQCSFASAN